MTAGATLTAAQLLEMLRRHYLKTGPFPGGVLAHEVGINGPVRQRRCDAVYVGFTSTSGRLMIGHEVKVSRSDWLHELAQPGKADAWADQCHAWYVVAPSTDVVRPEELPPGWGLITPKAGKLHRAVKAAEHLDRVPAWWAVRSVLARLDTLREQEIAGRVERSLEVRVREAEQRARQAVMSHETRHQRLADLIAARLGEEYRYANVEHVADAAARLFLDQQATEQASSARRYAVRDLERVRESITYTLAELAKPTEPLEAAP